MRLRAIGSAIGTTFTVLSSHAVYRPWASGTGPLRRLILAEWLCRAADRIDPPRVSRSCHRLERTASASDSAILRKLLQRHAHSLVIEQGRGTAPSIWQDLIYGRHQGLLIKEERNSDRLSTVMNQPIVPASN